jgi:colanic acid/amylovoran biosynthesis protein
MKIELRGINFFNKGAELMLQAVLQKVKEKMPNALFVMEQSVNASREKHLENGIHTKLKFRRFTPVKYLSALIPGFILRRWNYLTESEIDVVLDCSGYAFSDRWGARKASAKLGNHIVRWKKQGKKVIMLPQAFGPFTDPDLAKVMKHIVTYADLIYARDPVSFQYLKQLGAGTNNIGCAPDFTNLIQGIVPDNFDASTYEVAIIVNNKMVTAHEFNEDEAYVNLMVRIIEEIKNLNRNPFFLVHEVQKDINVTESIQQKLTTKLPVIIESNPLYIKGIISKSTAVVTSRFHGLVSSLSQAIPCLATSWSHKYEMLLEDYNYSEALLDAHCSDELLIQKVKSMLTEPSRSIIIEKLKAAGIRQKELSEEMWKQVFKKIQAT